VDSVPRGPPRLPAAVGTLCDTTLYTWGGGGGWRPTDDHGVKDDTKYQKSTVAECRSASAWTPETDPEY
jgi:hypothetical protein